MSQKRDGFANLVRPKGLCKGFSCGFQPIWSLETIESAAKTVWMPGLFEVPRCTLKVSNQPSEAKHGLYICCLTFMSHKKNKLNNQIRLFKQRVHDSNKPYLKFSNMTIKQTGHCWCQLCCDFVQLNQKETKCFPGFSCALRH